MEQRKTFEIQEFAQFIADKVDRLEGRLKGFHFVINAMANELRNSDPEQASRMAEFIASHSDRENLSEHAKEIVDMYVGVLTHEFRDPSELQ